MDMGEEKVLHNAVVCYLIDGDKFLMAMKTTKIGKGCFNGYGGGIENGESPKDATIREFWEETNDNPLMGVSINPESLEKVAVIDFHNTKSDGEIFVCRVHFYFAYKWSGEALDTETMINPTWFDKKNLPDEIMPADKDFLPIILGNKKIRAKYFYSPFQQTLLRNPEVEYVDCFSDD
ncbi:NUDIX domain-containing protein [Patescibacteria group bacterium]|nr:NUDIX domain-containing protein [Patescibacteria group bacterium]MCG2695122.1 NUDIX domain-containing protein [Candidatus Parcubacteria bacterium]